MALLDSIVGFAGTGLGKIIMGATGGFILWPLANWAWDFLKPLAPFLDFAVDKAGSWGRNTNSFLKKRVKDDVLRAKIIEELAQDSDKIKIAFVEGLRKG